MKNLKNWKTTAVGIIAGIGVLLPVLMPNADPEAVTSGLTAIVEGASMLVAGVASLVLIFGAKDSDKEE